MTVISTNSDAAQMFRKMLGDMAGNPDVMVEMATLEEGLISATSHYGAVRINIEISEIPQ